RDAQPHRWRDLRRQRDVRLARRRDRHLLLARLAPGTGIAALTRLSARLISLVDRGFVGTRRQTGRRAYAIEPHSRRSAERRGRRILERRDHKVPEYRCGNVAA